MVISLKIFSLNYTCFNYRIFWSCSSCRSPKIQNTLSLFVLYWGLSYDLTLKFFYQTIMLLTALEDKGWSLEEVLDFVMNWIFLGGSWKRRFNGNEMGKGEMIQNIEWKSFSIHYIYSNLESLMLWSSEVVQMLI